MGKVVTRLSRTPMRIVILAPSNQVVSPLRVAANVSGCFTPDYTDFTDRWSPCNMLLVRRCPNVNVRAERTKPCGLKSSPCWGLCPFSPELPAPGEHGNTKEGDYPQIKKQTIRVICVICGSLCLSTPKREIAQINLFENWSLAFFCFGHGWHGFPRRKPGNLCQSMPSMAENAPVMRPK